MVVEVNCFKKKKDRAGAEYYLHKLDGTVPIPPRPLPSAAPVADRADADTLHKVNVALLEKLHLSQAHRENLRQRGLSDEAIDRELYRTLPVRGRSSIAQVLRERFGDELLHVPGFIVKVGDRGPYVTIAGAAGLVVPVRDLQGRIIALKVRRDDAAKGEGKYSYISSTAHDGPGPGSPVHVPLGTPEHPKVVRVTEGELKANVAFQQSQMPTISIAGVSNFPPAIAILKTMTPTFVRLALDMDAKQKPAVAKALGNFAQQLDAIGFALELEQWPDMHKGIDDALVMGAPIKVLVGDSARRRITEIVAASGVQDATPGPVDRLDQVVSEGADSLFKNKELLEELAKLAEDAPAEFACVRAKCQRAKISVRSLDSALAPLRSAIRAAKPRLCSAADYQIVAGRIVRNRQTLDGPVEVPLCNFHCYIVEVVTIDDGAECFAVFGIEGATMDGRPLARIYVRASDFPSLDWVTARWHGLAVVHAGQGNRDHTRCAIELLSRDRIHRFEYRHTGWRLVGDRWLYLHAGGAIGANGLVDGVAVTLADPLSRFELPIPPDGEQLINSVKASLQFLDLAPERITVPVLASIYRAVLGETDFSLFLVGHSGLFKSELAAIAEQHFGRQMDARHLPGNWSSTDNALEELLFTAKDALVVLDDYKPAGTAHEMQSYQRRAERIFRNKGNHTAKQRLTRDGQSRPPRPPLALPLATGEEVPRGQSLRSRMFIVEIHSAGGRSEIDRERLTVCQRHAAAGLYDLCLAAFLQWLSTKFGAVREQIQAMREPLRLKVLASMDGHLRTPGIVADLAIGLQYFLDFALDVGVIRQTERDRLARRCWSALLESAHKAARSTADEEPAAMFLRLLAAVISSGRGYVANTYGGCPDNHRQWGWRDFEVGSGDSARNEARPQGELVGWIDGENLYLEPQSAYATVSKLARDQNTTFGASQRSLNKSLNDRGYLASTEMSRETLTIRKTLQGQRREVLHLLAKHLSCEPDQPDQSVETPTGNGESCGQVHSQIGQHPPMNPTNERPSDAGETAEMVGLVRSKSGVDHSAEEKSENAAAPILPPGAKLFFQDAHGRPCSCSESYMWTWEGGPAWFYSARFPPPGVIKNDH